MGHLRVLLEAVEQAAHVDLDLVVSRVSRSRRTSTSASKASSISSSVRNSARRNPSTITFTLPFGSLTFCTTRATTPIRWMSSIPGSSTFGSRWATRKISLPAVRSVLFQREHGTATADDEGRHHLREDHHVPQRHDRQPVARGRNVSGGHPYPAFSYTVSG